VPEADQNLPRTSTLEGRATPGALVDVWLEGEAEPLLRNIAVGINGRWSAEVTLPVGRKTIWARQTFEGRPSKDSPPLTYNVVPAAPSIETPATDEHIGRQAVFSGFGVPGDTVTVKLIAEALTVRGSTVVLDDRTWSVTVELDLPGGSYGFVAVASCDGFDSLDSPERPVVLGTYRPTIDVPAPGYWVQNPVHFEGQGRPGVGQVMSWFNPEHVWVPDATVETGWQGGAIKALPPGGNWCWIKQTLTDNPDGETVSDLIVSKRFEVLPPSTEP
jgi:hypothetical protein